MMATIKDIADLAGVSKATVSLVLNGKGNISDKMRKKIFLIAQELGYSSVLETRNSSKGLLAILVHEDYEKAFEWNFIRNIIIKLEAVVVESDYHLVLVPVNKSSSATDIVSRLSSFSPLGVFSIHYSNNELFNYLKSIKLPLVLINNSGYQNSITTVCTDDFQGVNEGVEHLIRLNHTKIAYMDYLREDLPEMVTDSYFGYLKALKAAHIIPSEKWHLTVSLSDMDSLTQKIKQVIEQEGITSIYALDDYLGARIMIALQKIGYKVPDDISVMASGDTLNFEEPFIPQITTMTVDTNLMGRVAGSFMLDTLSEKIKGPSVIKIKQTISERGSAKIL
jgi:LacI family transcriptional regulator